MKLKKLPRGKGKSIFHIFSKIFVMGIDNIEKQ